MKTCVKILLSILLIVKADSATAQKHNFIVLGDIHYDLMKDHDMEWLSTRPDDVRQVKEYTEITAEVWPDFTKALSAKALSVKPQASAVLQLGDLSEGLAGNPDKAVQMAANALSSMENSGIPAPWIITKGNHDITGPGAEEAFNSVYIPWIKKQTGNPDISSANYTWNTGNISFVVFDPWDRTGYPLEKLESNLKKSDSRYKFVLVHEPVIPVNERCWHLYRTDEEKRNRLLKVIAENNAVVFCAHLHLYSVVKRDTEYGPIVQIMANSVARGKGMREPENIITQYGPSLALNVPAWEPKSLEQRTEWLAEESKHITYFKQMDLPGYGILTIDEKKDDVSFSWYAAFGKEPFETISLSGL